MKKMCAFLILFCCFFVFTACQQTPDEAPVVNKAEGISEAMAAEPLREGETKSLDAPRHWTATDQRQDGQMEIHADIDIKWPEDLSNTPVPELEQVQLEQARLDDLIHYFVGEAQLYAPEEMTKADLENQLSKVKNREGKYGRYESEEIAGLQKALESMIEGAPDEVTRQPIDSGFTLPYVSESQRANMQAGIVSQENPVDAERYFNATADTDNGYEADIKASTYDPDAGTNSSFSYNAGGKCHAESYVTEQQEVIAQYDLLDGLSDNKIKWLEAEKENITQMNAVLDGVDETTAGADQKKAQQVLDELGIIDLELVSGEKAAFYMQSPKQWDSLALDHKSAKGGHLFRFVRSSGALSGYNELGGTAYTVPESEQTYVSPFPMETAEVFVSAGEVLYFSWDNMAKVNRTVVENTNLLPFDQVVKRFEDCMMYVYTVPVGEGGASDSMISRIDVTGVELRADYIPAKDNPDKVWMIPVWIFDTQQAYMEKGDDEPGIGYSIAFEISALDGSLIFSSGL